MAVGRTKILQCQALGFPQPQYRWLKDGDLISGFSSEHFYKIQSVEREDAGLVSCSVFSLSDGQLVTSSLHLLTVHSAPVITHHSGQRSEVTIRQFGGHQSVKLKP